MADGLQVPREDYVRLGREEVRRASVEVPGAMGAMLGISGTTIVAPPDGGRRRAARVTATLAGAAELYSLELAAGRFFNRTEDEHDVPVAVISYLAATELSGTKGPESMLGRTVRMRDSPRRVVGVLAPEPDEEGLAAYVPLDAAGTVMMPGQAALPRSLVLKAGRVEDVDALAGRVEDWLATGRRDWERDFTVKTRRAELEQMLTGLLVFRLFIGALAAISLVVGGIGIMNVLLASVTERTREIGIRKAAGARRRDILLQFLAESVAISGTGSAAGLVLGLVAAFGITAVIRASSEAPIQAGISVTTLVVAAVTALVVGLTFGTYPARRAARLSPIDAIRYE